MCVCVCVSLSLSVFVKLLEVNNQALSRSPLVFPPFLFTLSHLQAPLTNPPCPCPFGCTFNNAGVDLYSLFVAGLKKKRPELMQVVEAERTSCPAHAQPERHREHKPTDATKEGSSSCDAATPPAKKPKQTKNTVNTFSFNFAA